MTELEKLFALLQINFEQIAFYDTPEFMHYEQRDRRFLEKYGQFVNERCYSEEYLARARVEIPLIARLLNEELIKDGRMGACVDMSIGLNRILEREGFWNYPVKGSLTILLPKYAELQNKFFWSYDLGEFAAPHAWITAPPYTVIDLSIKQQSYIDNTANYLPNMICSESIEPAVVSDEDLISPRIRNLMNLDGIEDKIPKLRPNWENFSSIFRAVAISYNDVKMKYIPIGIAAPDSPLEEVATLRLSGKLAIEIYQEIIRPQLKELRNA